MRKNSTNTASDFDVDFEMGVRRLTVLSAVCQEADGHDLHVDCPLVRERVPLERCIGCVHGKGLLLDPEDGALTLRCAYEPSLEAAPTEIEAL